MTRWRKDPPWTAFEEAHWTEAQLALMRKLDDVPDSTWRNNLYQVTLRKVPKPDDWPEIIHMSIKRIDRAPIDRNHWRILQRIKNLLVGPEHEGFELFPAESRLVDTSNQYHLFVFADAGARMPVGWWTRTVGEKSSHGAVQRPFEEDDERPADLNDDKIKHDMDRIHGKEDE